MQALSSVEGGYDLVALWVPRNSSASRDQAILVDQATNASLVPLIPEVHDRLGTAAGRIQFGRVSGPSANVQRV